MIPELLPTALAFYRAPGQYGQLRDARVPLPAGVTDLLAAHAHALAAEQIEDTAARLDSSPEECRAAVTFFIKQALLEARGDYYRILGVSRDADSALIRQHYHYLIRLFHPDRDLDREGWETLYAPVINEAWNQLRTPAKRSQYDASLPQPDAFDAVLAQGHNPAGAETLAATPRASAPGARAEASAVTGILAGLPPRLVLGLVFGVPLLLILLLLLAKPAPQNLRLAGQDIVLPEAGESEPPAAAASQRKPAEAGLPSGIGEPAVVSGGGIASASVPTARAAPRRATSEELEQQVRQRLASATNAVLGPGAAARARRQTAAPETAATAQTAVPIPVPEVGAAALAQPTSVDEPEPGRGPERETELAAAAASAPESGLLDSPSSVSVAEPPPAAAAQQAPATAAAPASEATPAAPLPALDGAQLAAVVAAFARSYEAGDVQHFSALFAENADTSDARGRDEIRNLYRDFFARPETREIRFGQMLWQYDSPFRSRGTGPARVTTAPLDGGEAASGELMITLEVEQTLAGPSIVALYYH